MNKPQFSYRRIDQLKAIAFDCGFTTEDAKDFGKLSKTATWEAMLETYGVLSCADSVLDKTLDKSVDSVDNKVQSRDTSEWANDGTFPVCFTSGNSTSFLDWVDFGQLLALALASVGMFVLALNLWRQINPFNLLPPIKVNIQIGTKL